MACNTDEQQPDPGLKSIVVSAVRAIRNPAVLAAMVTVGVVGIGLISLPCAMGITAGVPFREILSGLAIALLIGAAVTMIGGLGIGWFANYWFRETKIPPDQAATLIALVFNCFVGGWLVVWFVRFF